MSRLWKRTRNLYKSIPEPSSLNTNPMVKEGKLAGVVAVPLIALLAGLITYAKMYAATQEDFMLFAVVGLVIWGVGMFGMFFSYQIQANMYILFDREFGFTPRLRPRDEIYCKPEDIRELIGPNDYVQDFEQFKTKVTVLGLPVDVEKDILDRFKKKDAVKKFLYYFRHKDKFEGWNASEHTMPLFQSHVVFTVKPYRETFEFGPGQENWFGPITYNHTHSESDNVKVMEWGVDPFSGESMPICDLIHSSKDYENNGEQPSDKEFKIIDAQAALITYEHGLNENYRKDLANLQTEQNAKYHEVDSISKHGHAIAHVDHVLWKDIMKETSRGLLKSTFAKVLITALTIGAIVFLICYLLGWINLSGILGGGGNTEPSTTGSILFYLRSLLHYRGGD